MSKRGDSGVARVQGLVIFVPGTHVDDNVKIRITKLGQGYATAEVVGQNTMPESTSGAIARTEEDKEEGDEASNESTIK